MQLVATPIDGAYVIELDRLADDRGFFARLWCNAKFTSHGLKADIVQSNVGVSRKAGTLRGLHFQRDPHAEVKVVRCPRGAVYDVIVDLRPDSSSYLRWFGVELSADNGQAIYVPEGCAQGYLTLSDHTEIYYHTSASYHPESASGVRYDDPTFGIEWPRAIGVVSAQDRNWPDWTGTGETTEGVVSNDHR